LDSSLTPRELMRLSVEADLFPLNYSERADVIDGSIGELSPFHETFGYYAQGVAEEIAILPQNWRERLVVIQNENTRGARGLCLEVHDLLVAKAVAGREKDVAFLEEAARHHMADAEVMFHRLATVTVDPAVREKARAMIVVRHNLDTIDRALPGWLEGGEGGLQTTVRDLPLREQIDVPVREQLIVELYSK